MTNKAVSLLLMDLKECSKTRDLQRGKQVHGQAVSSGHDSITYVLNALINMYTKCGSMILARGLFDSVEKPSVVGWNSLLLGYAQNGNNLLVLDLFSVMISSAYIPTSVTFLAALKACANLAAEDDAATKKYFLKQCIEIHLGIGCYQLDPNVQNMLIYTYAKCGSMGDARRVFDSMQDPDLVSWNSLIMGYAEHGEGHISLGLFSRMKKEGFLPDSVTYFAAMKAVTSLSNDSTGRLEAARQIRLEACDFLRGQSRLKQHIKNALINMFAKCGSMIDAQGVFDGIEIPDVVACNTLLLGYVENRKPNVALTLFSRMKASGFVPDSTTYVAALKACIGLAAYGDKGGCLECGREIHSRIRGLINPYLQNTLIDLYAKCNSMVEAHDVFNDIKQLTVVSWNVLLMGYAESGQGRIVLDLFLRMKARGFGPDSVSYIAALKACTNLAANGDGIVKTECLQHGRTIHSEINCKLDSYLQSALIDMYSKCGSMVDARRMFDEMKKPCVFSWSALLSGYVEHGQAAVALVLFSSMKSSGCVPDSVTYVSAVKACASLAKMEDAAGKTECLQRGREIHSQIGSHTSLYLQSTLINMYGNCGSMTEALSSFESIEKPDVVSWNSLLLGYVDNGEGLVVLDCFLKMKSSGCKPDPITYSAAIKACSLLGALTLGRILHAEISEFTVLLITCLVDFYAKCGSMLEARQVFHTHAETRDVYTWTVLIAGYGRFGEIQVVVNLVHRMQDEGFMPDAVSVLCVMMCFSHAGLVENAKECFEGMHVQYGVSPSIMHYNCMVDAFGRASQLKNALELLRKMPCSSNAVTWRVLLAACRRSKNVEVGRLAVQSLLAMNDVDNEQLMYSFQFKWLEASCS